MTTMSSKPCSRSSSTMCSMHGLPTIGTIGFGWFDVSGRRRVPSPPAITTAFTSKTSRRALATYTPSDDERGRGRPRRSRAASRARVRDDHEAEAGVEEPGRGLAEHVDLEPVAAPEQRAASPTSSEQVAQRDHEREPGSRSAMQSRITAASIISRSASGSAILPNADSTCQRRARKPSTWSVTPATPKTIAAAQLVPVVGRREQHDEDRDQHEPGDRQRVRQLQRSGATPR